MSQVTRSFERIFTWKNPEIVNPTSLPTSRWQTDPHFPSTHAPIQKDPYWHGRVDMSKPAYTGHPEKNERVASYPTPRGAIHVVTPAEPPKGFMPTTAQLNFPMVGEQSFKARLPPKRTRY